MKLLLVEDDARLAQAVRAWMGHGGIDVDWITHGREVEPALRGGGYDGMVLDLGLPDTDGETVLSGVRAAGFELPVIVMTARERVQDRVRLLDLGADDFLVKPVHLDELAARLRAVRRRQGAGAPRDETLRHGPLALVPASRTVSVDGEYALLSSASSSCSRPCWAPTSPPMPRVASARRRSARAWPTQRASRTAIWSWRARPT